LVGIYVSLWGKQDATHTNISQFQFTVMKPVFVTIQHMHIRGHVYSTVFTATFSDGKQKTLHLQEEFHSIRPHEKSGQIIALDPAECVLYHRDWTDCPQFGKFNQHYPK